MKLPKKIKILGIPYTVKYVNAMSKVGDEGDNFYGLIDHTKGTITAYGDNRPKEMIWRTIWHEILHALFESFDITADAKESERIIQQLAPAINSVIIDNKFMEY